MSTNTLPSDAHTCDSRRLNGCTSPCPIVVCQVTDALVPRILALTADTPLSEAMRAFRLTRNEFAVVVSSSGFDTYQAPSDSSAGGDRGRLTGQTGTNGDTTDWHAQTLLAEVRGRDGLVEES